MAVVFVEAEAEGDAPKDSAATPANCPNENAVHVAVGPEPEKDEQLICGPTADCAEERCWAIKTRNKRQKSFAECRIIALPLS
jgi:hypothetical protein